MGDWVDDNRGTLTTAFTGSSSAPSPGYERIQEFPLQPPKDEWARGPHGETYAPVARVGDEQLHFLGQPSNEEKRATLKAGGPAELATYEFELAEREAKTRPAPAAAPNLLKPKM
jgi:hypothetical protein